MSVSSARAFTGSGSGFDGSFGKREKQRTLSRTVIVNIRPALESESGFQGRRDIGARELLTSESGLFLWKLVEGLMSLCEVSEVRRDSGSGGVESCRR